MSDKWTFFGSFQADLAFLRDFTFQKHGTGYVPVSRSDQQVKIPMGRRQGPKIYVVTK